MTETQADAVIWPMGLFFCHTCKEPRNTLPVRAMGRGTELFGGPPFFLVCEDCYDLLMHGVEHGGWSCGTGIPVELEVAG